MAPPGTLCWVFRIRRQGVPWETTSAQQRTSMSSDTVHIVAARTVHSAIRTRRRASVQASPCMTKARHRSRTARRSAPSSRSRTTRKTTRSPAASSSTRTTRFPIPQPPRRPVEDPPPLTDRSPEFRATGREPIRPPPHRSTTGPLCYSSLLDLPFRLLRLIEDRTPGATHRIGLSSSIAPRPGSVRYAHYRRKSPAGASSLAAAPLLPYPWTFSSTGWRNDGRRR